MNASRPLHLNEEELLVTARGDDAAAFEQLVAGYRRELTAHCYRMLGSPHDAEDAVQESLLSAWRGLAAFEGRSSLRTWLYRISTNACLRLTAQRPRRLLSPDYGPPRRDTADLGEPVTGPVWLEPWPDDVPADEPDPAARYLRREERADVDTILTLLADDVRFTMPPLPAWFDGREDVGRFLAERVFATAWRLMPIRANGQPALERLVSLHP